MADDLIGSPQNDLIGLRLAYEVREWCLALGCDEAQLRVAVWKVGNSAQQVREYLAQHQH